VQSRPALDGFVVLTDDRRQEAPPADPADLARYDGAVAADVIAEIVERAKTSRRTFYEYFDSKEDAMVAALDSGSAQMLAAALPAPGYELAPDTPPIAAEAIGGAVYALVYDQVKAHGPESLPELVPMATYMTLAPFLGAERAYELATEGNSRR
jgi:AcrR family transcriptional regulator